MSSRKGREPDARGWIAKQFTRVEEVVYVALGVLLTGCAAALLVTGPIDCLESLISGKLVERIVPMLGSILLGLLVVEILYAVQVSGLPPEAFTRRRWVRCL
jgi:hypothetical protein